MKILSSPRRLRRILLALIASFALLSASAFPPAFARHQSGPPAQSRYGGTLSYRDIGTPTCVDPLPAPTTVEGVIDYATFENLVLLDSKDQPRPDLATSWSYSHGGRWITFKLRRGVRFSNGDPFNASVVRFNILRALGPVGAAAGMSALVGPLRTARVDSPYQVTLILNAPFRPLLPNLANDSLGIVDPIALSKEGKTRFCQYPIGTGPFKIQSFGPGGNPVTLVRNPYHTWGWPWAYNHGLAYLNKIIVKPVLSDSTAASELLAGGISAGQTAGSQMSRLQHNPDVTVHKILSQFVTQMIFNSSHKPFNNPVVRRAISEAINRYALVKVALNGFGKPAFSPIARTVPYYDPASQNLVARYNPADAQRILAANHVTGPYTLITRNEPIARVTGELIQAELANVGVKVNVVSKPPPDWISMGQKGQFDMNVADLYFPDADVLYLSFHSSQESGGGLNFTFYKSPTLDRLIVEGRTTNNPSLASRYYAQAQRLILGQGLEDPLYTPYHLYATRSNVKGLHTDCTALFPVFQDLYFSK